MTFGRYVLTADVTVPGGLVSYPAASTPQTTSGTTGATPSSDTTITTQTVTAATAGTYLLSWTATLQTSAGGGDANNFQLYNSSASVVLATSVNAGAVGSYPQAPVLAQLATGNVVLVRNNAAGSSGSVYAASLTTVLTQQGDIKGCVAFDGAGSPPQWAQQAARVFLAGTPLYLDTNGVLYAAIGSGNLRAWIDGTDVVGHGHWACLGN